MMMTGGSFTVGCEVIVQSDYSPLVYVPATISAISKNKRYSLITSDDNPYEDPYDDVSEGRLYLLVRTERNDVTLRLLQRALLMNLARCCMKLMRFGWAILHCCHAKGITDGIFERTRDYGKQKNSGEPYDITKMKTDELFLLCKSLIAANRPNMAEKVTV